MVHHQEAPVDLPRVRRPRVLGTPEASRPEGRSNVLKHLRSL